MADYVSPYPTNADLDLDMLRAQGYAPTIAESYAHTVRHVVGQGLDIGIRTTNDEATAADRDAMARRIEMMGDLYEEARLLEERYTILRAFVETHLPAAPPFDNSDQLRKVLGEFVAPKPFPRATEGD